MTLSQPYDGLPPYLKVRFTLYYISQFIAAEPELGDYAYDLPDPWDDATEGDFDLLVWNDSRTKPTWQDVLDNYADAYNYVVGNGIYVITDKERLDYLDSYIEEVLEPHSLLGIRTTSDLSLSLVGTGATGTQISSTKDSTVRVTVSTSITSAIASPSTSMVALKICATNSSTEGDWATVTSAENDQIVALALILQTVNLTRAQLCADVPAGWYVKIVNSGTGTHSEAFISGQKTIYG